jgi:hypothetical protein
MFSLIKSKSTGLKSNLSRKIFLYSLFSALIIQRFLHFKNSIDEPMAWRQFDTEFFAFSFYKDGINLLKPSVCWLGGYKNLMLEFPIVSAVISVFYKVLGHSIVYAHLVIFIFFLLSALYFYLLIKHLYYKRLAVFAVLIYLMLPTGLYYSQALTIDFPVMFFSLAALYYYILGFDKKNYVYISLAGLFAVLGFITKAPYVYYIIFPLFYYAVKHINIRFILRSLPLLLIPPLAFFLWQIYCVKLNALAPDYPFLPDYYKYTTNMSAWYFGTLSDRLTLINWELIAFRLGAKAITYMAFPFFITGIFAKKEVNNKNKFFYVYAFGTVSYILIFFMLIATHDYYMVPLVVITSFFIANGIDFVYRKLKPVSLKRANIVTAVIILAIMINSIWLTEKLFYIKDEIRSNTAQIINSNSNENDLIISSIDETNPRDPRILAAAYRCGWSVKTPDLSPYVIRSLINEGAVYLAVTLNQDLAPELKIYLDTLEKQEFKISDNGWKLQWYKLK